VVNPLPSSHRAQAHPYDLRSATGRAGRGEVMRLRRMLASGRASRLFGRLAPLASPPLSAGQRAPRLAVRRPGAGRRRRVGVAVEGGLDEADGMAPIGCGGEPGREGHALACRPWCVGLSRPGASMRPFARRRARSKRPVVVRPAPVMVHRGRLARGS